MDNEDVCGDTNDEGDWSGSETLPWMIHGFEVYTCVFAGC
jgi:hypothetical protein